VRTNALESRALVAALERGDFYSSTGVVLDAVEPTAAGLRIVVKATPYSKYRVQFIGRGGRTLREVEAAEATYAFAGDEGYVRARVIESNGGMAWTQPVGVGRDAPR
jgi:superfamily II DNA or RNA helicase